MTVRNQPRISQKTIEIGRTLFPSWLHFLSMAALVLGVIWASVVVVDLMRHPQKMAVMNVVWPVTALFGTVLTVWAYFAIGRASSQEAMKEAMHKANAGHGGMPSDTQPMAAFVGKGSLYCGAGCMIGDLIAEWLAFFFPVLAIWCGWQSIFDEKIFAIWVLDFLFAFVLGIVFQYFAIVPMRGLSPREGLLAALKADTLSLASWQVGMYGFMAIAQFYLLPHFFGRQAEVNSLEFWFTMQLAMLCGFITAAPVNWLLIRSRIKEKM
jgi:hypothetical protein